MNYKDMMMRKLPGLARRAKPGAMAKEVAKMVAEKKPRPQFSKRKKTPMGRSYTQE